MQLKDRRSGKDLRDHPMVRKGGQHVSHRGSDPLSITPTLLAKLGSIIVHFQEATEPGAHEFDVAAARVLLMDEDVRAWLDGVRSLGLLPLKRSERGGS